MPQTAEFRVQRIVRYFSGFKQPMLDFSAKHLWACFLALHLALGATTLAAQMPGGTESPLPNAPSAVYAIANNDAVDQAALLPPCPPALGASTSPSLPDPQSTTAPAPPRCVNQNPLRIVVDAEVRQPLTVRQKGLLAGRDIIDPFNLIVIAGEAGIGVAANSHSAYGPGFKGFGRAAGYDLLQDAQGEVFGTFLIPALAHEDPRYRRMQNASVPRRFLHALERTVIAQHDDGRNMPNYATLLTYPISAELSNLYVPGIQSDRPSTARRIAIGLATDPAGNLIAEFLPDLARRIHVRSVVIQEIVNRMVSGAPE
ncbi:MAG: hypothetical protein M3R43_09285 [Acidobacteriota bacterium]|nr:hypothetical protein [Acidobacteriota bacterium]